MAPIDITTVVGIGGPQPAEVYLVNIALPNQVVFSKTRVTKAISTGDGCDVLIGMNIINKGDFAVTHPNGNTQFTFRIPPQADIDFVKEDRPGNQRERMNELAQAKKTSRQRSTQGKWPPGRR